MSHVFSLGSIIAASALVLLSTVSMEATASMLTPQQRALGITTEDLEANSKKLGNISTRLNQRASRYKFNGMATYSLRQDLAAQVSPSIATHRALGLASIAILDRPVVAGFDDEFAHEVVTLNFAASGQFKTIGSEVQGNVQGGPVDASDIDVSASRSFQLNNLGAADSFLDLTLGSTVPTSDSTRYEGIVAVPYVNLGWALSFQGGRYNLTQALSSDYVINTFSKSPTTLEANQSLTTGYTVSTSARLGAGFRLTVGGAAHLVNYLDTTATTALSNFQILSWTKGFTTVSLRHTNGARAEDNQSTLWFIDEYRRLISLGVSVRF